MAMVMMSGFVKAGETIKLPPVVKGVPATLMQALEKRQSVREFDKGNIPRRELSNLLWAANGVNREDGKRTAPSALNKQDVDVYVCMENGAYKYDAKGHALVQVTDKDVRPAVAAQQTWAADAPVVIVLVSVIAVDREHGEHADQVDTLAHHVGQGNIVRVMVIGVEGQNAAGQGVHHIPARRLHNHIPYKIPGQGPLGRQNLLELFQLFFVRQRPEQNQVGHFLKPHPVFRQKTLGQLVDINAPVVQFPFAGDAFPIYRFGGDNVGDLG